MDDRFDEIAAFVQAFHGTNEVRFVAFDKRTNRPAKHLLGRFTPEMDSELRALNEQGYEIGFIVNSGGYTAKVISRVHAIFVDLDAGEAGEYLPIAEAEARKPALLQRIRDFPLKPSYIAVTRNGYQVHYLCVFRTKPSTCSERTRPVIPNESVHSFRRKVSTRSE